jgi:hypothetical protein
MRAIALLAFALLVPIPAQADTIYSYVGDTFRSVSGVYTLSDRITGSFTVLDGFIAPPTAVGNDFTAGVIAYSFTDGHQTFTEANSTGRFLLYPLSPWDVAIRSLSTPTAAYIETYLNGDRVDVGQLGLADYGFNRVSTGPPDGSHVGTWTVTTVPEPATVALLGAGLVVLSASLWRGRARG